MVSANWHDASGKRNDVRAAIWAMYKLSYATVGLNVLRPADLDEYDVWELALDDKRRPIAFRLGKTTRFGVKGGLVGTDGRTAGKGALRAHLAEWFKQTGRYGEVSHAVEALVARSNPNAVCAAGVGSIIDKVVVPERDGLHYRRHIANIGTVTKVLVGRPRGVPTTSYRHPSCPVVLAGTTRRQPSTDRSRAALLDHAASLIAL